MCGIFGVSYAGGRKPVNRSMVESATRSMAHRGPDDEGFYYDDDEGVGLGHRRLSIIDLSAGHQPMFNEDDSIVIVYNGEIYNYQEIFEKLKQKGHFFRTKCDTEVIIHAYEEWSVRCLDRFNGMFAFALWDKRERTLWVVRDRLGIKPLYYFWDGKTFIFSSEVKPILETGLVRARRNDRVLDSYLSLGYVPAPETIFRDILKVMPGHYLLLREGDLGEREYWDFANIEESDLSYGEACDKVNGLVRDSIGKRLMSDVPLGAFLSGGLDSSAVVSIMSSLTDSPVKTFTIGYDEKYGVSEEKFARIVADRFGTEHHLFRLEPSDFMDSMQTLLKFSEEPIVEPAAIALYHIAKLARNHAIVLLSGEGSDEVFAGYYLYQFMKRLENVQRFIPAGLLGCIAKLGSFSSKFKYMKYLDWMATPLNKRYQGTSSYLTRTLKESLYSDEFLAMKGDYLEDTFARYHAKVEYKDDIINKMLYVDTKTWLVDDLLLKADKMTMAASVELRVPFLDYRLVELASSLPSRYKVNNGNAKQIVKTIMKECIPDVIVNRQKMGFPVPTATWFGSAIITEICDRILSADFINLLNKDKVESAISRHKEGKEDHSKLIMTLLVMSVWEESYLNAGSIVY